MNTPQKDNQTVSDELLASTLDECERGRSSPDAKAIVLAALEESGADPRVLRIIDLGWPNAVLSDQATSFKTALANRQAGRKGGYRAGNAKRRLSVMLADIDYFIANGVWAPSNALAAATGVSRRTVRRWRASNDYKEVARIFE